MPTSRRVFFTIALALALSFGLAFQAETLLAQGGASFGGEWKLNPARCEPRGASGEPILHVEQTAWELKIVHQDGHIVSYSLDGSSGRSRQGDLQFNTKTKWEGDSLLVSTLVSGAKSYSVSERWTASHRGTTLTVIRTVSLPQGESETSLVYEKPGAEPPVISKRETVPAAPPQTAELAVRPPEHGAESLAQHSADRNYVVTQGTRVLMRLTSSLNTKGSAAGDRVYLETAAPVFIEGRLVVPAGSYVTARVTESTRAGRVSGRAGLNLRYESLTLPNGTSRELSSRTGSVEGGGHLDREEGRIKGEGNKGGDAKTVAKTTAAGAGVGTVVGAAAGHYGLGAGAGAAAGAVAGLATVFAKRGPDVILRPGTTIEFVLDRDLEFTESELAAPVR